MTKSWYWTLCRPREVELTAADSWCPLLISDLCMLIVLFSQQVRVSVREKAVFMTALWCLFAPWERHGRGGRAWSMPCHSPHVSLVPFNTSLKSKNKLKETYLSATLHPAIIAAWDLLCQDKMGNRNKQEFKINQIVLFQLRISQPSESTCYCSILCK